MSEKVEKIQSLMENSESFAILLDKNPEEHELLAKEALKQTISSKNIPVLNLPQDSADFREKWSAIIKPATNTRFPQKTSIKLPKGNSVEEISYKKDGDNLALIITSNGHDITKENISLEKLPPEIGTVFCFFENPTKIENYKNQLQFPDKENIIFITSDKKTLTEKISDIIKVFNPNALNNESISAPLLASLLTETENLSENVTKEILSLANSLFENKEGQEAISKILEKEKKPSFTHLLGRILARTYVDDSLNVSWSFLNHQDLKKTGNIDASPVFLYRLLKKTKPFMSQKNLRILIWQSMENVKAIVSAGINKGENYLMPLAEKMGTRPQSQFFVVGPFENFSGAEIYLRQNIKSTKLN